MSNEVTHYNDFYVSYIAKGDHSPETLLMDEILGLVTGEETALVSKDNGFLGVFLGDQRKLFHDTMSFREAVEKVAEMLDAGSIEHFPSNDPREWLAKNS